MTDEDRQKSSNASFALLGRLGASSVYLSGRDDLAITDPARQMLDRGEEFCKLVDLHVNCDTADTDGIILDIGTRGDRLADDPETEVWTSADIILSWEDVEGLRDALTFMLSFATR